MDPSRPRRPILLGTYFSRYKLILINNNNHSGKACPSEIPDHRTRTVPMLAAAPEPRVLSCFASQLADVFEEGVA